MYSLESSSVLQDSQYIISRAPNLQPLLRKLNKEEALDEPDRIQP